MSSSGPKILGGMALHGLQLEVDDWFSNIQLALMFIKKTSNKGLSDAYASCGGVVY